MPSLDDDLAAFWCAADDTRADGMHAELRRVLRDVPERHPRALFERASLHDFLGQEVQAIPLYRAALDAGIEEPHRTEALIQLASSLRNVGDPSGAMSTLQQVDPADDLADAARAFLALALFDDGKPAAALRTALQALSAHMPAYERSIDAYAEELRTPDRVRVIAVGLLVRDGWVLAEEYVGREGDRFLRAPGGGVEFGERADDAVRREFSEELDVALDGAHLLGVVENIFDAHGRRGHEIVYVYEIRCAALEALPLSQRIAVRDADTTVGWYRLDTLGAGALPFHPVEALDLRR